MEWSYLVFPLLPGDHMSRKWKRNDTSGLGWWCISQRETDTYTSVILKKNISTSKHSTTWDSAVELLVVSMGGNYTSLKKMDLYSPWNITKSESRNSWQYNSFFRLFSDFKSQCHAADILHTKGVRQIFKTTFIVYETP